jgi:hypothetical protein
MNLEDTQHNLRIIGKLFLILGLIILPLSIFSYNSINFLFGSEWINWDEAFQFGVFHLRFPYELLYILPALYGIFALFILVTGIGLIYDLKWAKKLVIFPAVLMLFNFPLGTALGLFVLYQLHKDQQVRPDHAS